MAAVTAGAAMRQASQTGFAAIDGISITISEPRVVICSTDAIDASGALTSRWLGACMAAVVHIRGDVDAFVTALGQTPLARNAAPPIRARRDAVSRGSRAAVAAASAVLGGPCRRFARIHLSFSRRSLPTRFDTRSCIHPPRTNRRRCGGLRTGTSLRVLPQLSGSLHTLISLHVWPLLHVMNPRRQLSRASGNKFHNISDMISYTI